MRATLRATISRSDLTIYRARPWHGGARRGGAGLGVARLGVAWQGMGSMTNKGDDIPF